MQKKVEIFVGGCNPNMTKGKNPLKISKKFSTIISQNSEP